MSSHRKAGASRRVGLARVLEANSNLPNAVHRRKSRSPDARMAERSSAGSSIISLPRKRKPHAATNASTSIQVEELDSPADRGRRGKSRSTMTTITQSRFAAENEIGTSVASHSRSGAKEKERSRARDANQSHVLRRHAASEALYATASEIAADSHHEEHTVTQAVSEFTRLKKEIEALKKTAHENKKMVKRQKREIERLEEEATTQTKAAKEASTELQIWKTKAKKSEEIVSGIESNLQCQICMELLLRPFALSPCGHVLCQGCLQEWFRKAPSNDDEMYDSDDPGYLLYRRKSCPCCRTSIQSRPIPIFIMKSIATTLYKAKSPTQGRALLSRSPPVSDEDPWADFFRKASDGEDSIDEDEDDDEDDEDSEDSDEWAMNIFEYGSGSEDEPYEGEYLPAEWEPAFGADDMYTTDSEDELSAMIYRGANDAMIDLYEMKYYHYEGLRALIFDDDGIKMMVYLGWNIRLSADDASGSEYMDWVLSDIEERPERWSITHSMDGTCIARKLVPADEEGYDSV